MICDICPPACPCCDRCPVCEGCECDGARLDDEQEYDPAQADEYDEEPLSEEEIWR